MLRFVVAILTLRVVYRRLAGRRGRKKALIAIAHRILIALYHMFENANLIVTWESITCLTNGNILFNVFILKLAN
jgi:hypothetical protein